jgi:hypothetical protein
MADAKPDRTCAEANTKHDTDDPRQHKKRLLTERPSAREAPKRLKNKRNSTNSINSSEDSPGNVDANVDTRNNDEQADRHATPCSDTRTNGNADATTHSYAMTKTQDDTSDRTLSNAPGADDQPAPNNTDKRRQATTATLSGKRRRTHTTIHRNRSYTCTDGSSHELSHASGANNDVESPDSPT